MNKQSYRFRLHYMLAICLFVVQAISAQSTAKASLTLTSDALQVPSGDYVWLTVVLTNLSDHAIDCSAMAGSSGTDRNFRYEVTQSGAPVSKIVVDHPELEAFSYQPCTIGPGENATRHIAINRIYQMLNPGEYTVRLSRLVSGDTKDGYVFSNSVRITIENPKQAR